MELKLYLLDFFKAFYFSENWRFFGLDVFNSIYLTSKLFNRRINSIKDGLKYNFTGVSVNCFLLR